MSAYRMMKLRKNIRYALFAGMAGAFLIPQISFAAPRGAEPRGERRRFSFGSDN